jgi:N-acetylglucosamine kinase-like BadF-type ATPase
MFLLSLNFITSTYTETEIEDISSIEPIRGNRPLLVQLMTEAQSDSPRTIGAFAQELMKMLHNLMAAQAKHEEVNKKMVAQCLEEDAFRKKEVSDAQNSFNASSNALSKCQASLHAAKENLPALVKAKKDYDDELAAKTAERAKQHALYVQRANDWKEAIAFLNEFITMVNSKLAKYPTSLAELSETLLKHASKLGLVAEAVPVLIAMAQSPDESSVDIPHAKNSYQYQAQGSTVNNLKTQLSNLMMKLVTDSKQNDINEALAAKLFNELKARLEAIISKLASDIIRTEKQITDMNACIANEQAIITTASNKLNRNKTLQSAASHTCSDFAQEFVKATKNRLEEIQTVQQIIDIVKKRFKDLPEDLVKYLEEVKVHFKTYVNSTQFKKYEEYVQKQVANNVNGQTLARRVGKAVAPKASAKAAVSVSAKTKEVPQGANLSIYNQRRL